MKTTAVDSNHPLISNSFVTCYSDYLAIHLYYFPFGKKKVKYNNIVSCELHSMDDIGIFECKLWGMSLSPIWWHCDMRRLGRKYYILLDAGQWPLIGLTMNDNDIINVYHFIKQRISSNQSSVYYEKYLYNPLQTVSEKELEHQKYLQNVKKN
ncbi:unnamed protein product [Rotaria magnacalcarata]|uniref:Uncharacterized protein n=1 Tax=Rotaria magnacalcarata TaxID=392030 RepID=A0A816U1K0_9BILA|nr:unnamed protein product [Rotaria magnacalcarata]CAF1675719.1 unnamed protein product [Rotaria magnacalcarata]CAF1932151.1 unnamed protein product [Rotaria magnacalcarata]CAF2104593.1 unnamed protein product [Rotaria magnacalcarata]CAF2149738.1 unnamed protein product [Rotaria magnacalcarata]